MNTFKNYKELEDNIVDWMDRQDVRDKVSSFIRLVTVDVSRELRIPTMEHTIVLPVYADGTAFIPGDLIEAKTLNFVTLDSEDNIEERFTLNRSSLHEYNKSRESSDHTTPNSFATNGGKFKVFPLPKVKDKIVDGQPVNDTVVGHLELSYYILPLTINDPDEHNWVLLISPDIYFYGGLMHSYRYIRDYDGAQFWEQKYISAINKLQGSVNIAAWAGGPIVVGG